MINKVGLYLNTIRYLKISQIKYLILLRLVRKQKKYYREKELHLKDNSLCIRSLDCNNNYIDKFFPEKLLQNQLVLLNESFNWNRGNWSNSVASHLWNFNLHYFEYGIALVSKYIKCGDLRYKAKFFEMVKDWIDTVSEGDGWEAYTISLRIPNWLIAFEILEEKPPQYVIDSLYTQYRWLLRNQEKHLLGNHYFENLKTIVICSVYFAENKIFNKYVGILLKEINIQILKDGVHFELSLMYHHIILEDIMRIAHLLRKDKELLGFLMPVLQNMLSAMYSLEKGMGKIPHFNDGGEGVAKSNILLEKSLYEEWKIIPQEKQNFFDSGYHKIYVDKIAILFDCGQLGPRYMCGHAHCDALSFEMSIDSEPILVNSGTYQYQHILRNYFRSTEAHNTVLINHSQQSELWGEHRTARRIKCFSEEIGSDYIRGAYRTYRGYYHQRKIRFLNCSEIEIIDILEGPIGSKASAFFHASPCFKWEKGFKEFTFNLVCVEGNVKLEVSLAKEAEVVIHKGDILGHYSAEFGKLLDNDVLEIQYKLKSKKEKRNIVLKI